MRNVPQKSILLKRVRAYYTTRGCRVQTVYFTSMHGELIEEVELSCFLQEAAAGALNVPTKSSRPLPSGLSGVSSR